MNTDKIVKRVMLKAPLGRVWRAISDSREFGAWFGAKFEGPFVAGESVKAMITGTEVDPEVAAQQKPFEGTAFEIPVLRLEPERLLAFRWFPYGCWPEGDSPGYQTLVEFELNEAPEGVELTITESGFENIPIEKRKSAFEMNSHGWEAQTMLISKFLEQRP